MINTKFKIDVIFREGGWRKGERVERVRQAMSVMSYVFEKWRLKQQNVNIFNLDFEYEVVCRIIFYAFSAASVK